MIKYIDTNKIEIPEGFFNDLNVPKLFQWLNNIPTVDAQAADVQEVRYCKFELVQDGKGVCSNCHRLDSIDKLAKCCRYCGAFIKWDDDSNG